MTRREKQKQAQGAFETIDRHLQPIAHQAEHLRFMRDACRDTLGLPFVSHLGWLADSVGQERVDEQVARVRGEVHELIGAARAFDREICRNCKRLIGSAPPAPKSGAAIWAERQVDALGLRLPRRRRRREPE